ncbi:hypothetical protein SSEA_SKINNY_64 [Mycobacterium phage Skinny]|uniref:Uncharacterized protein n=6 Tax=Bongovirus bongo TaxID=1983750 RepID=A0A0M4RBY8_9CAUD|nr:hypothetical protein PEGLEG_62 [Mycobacterium phage PegLeg]YP_009604920.1 hypothetical protein FDH95_gp062 [Mycobacterium phage Bongo]ALF00590.1 hypothetical protein SEA_BRICOLE_62 [Mycobacterium phage Bricole]AXQ52703.1 hypothetical protein SEA_IPHANE7_62 [Mycobacterium phage IPhane7]QDH93635.1 hypothetical protein SEA_LILHOMIEP_61 [Mycobacterium phage LilhomieP]QGJ93209.1 hypothetical protein SEA_TYDAWG_62 [Mycobacterium phage TyDawg]QUU29262.1 hypothetical protein [Mycobacterium phage S
MATSILKIRGPYGPDGSQGDDGVELYNDEVVTPYGVLGTLRLRREDGKRFITQADGLILIRRGYPAAWTEESLAGVEMHETPFGVQLFKLTAENGFVTYRLLDDDLRWEDEFDGIVSTAAEYQLAMLIKSQWFEVFPPPEKYRHEVITRDLKLVDPQ